MADLKITAAQPAQAVSSAPPQKADSVIAKHLKTLKEAAFSETGSAILAGAAAGALVGNLPGAIAGGLVGLGLSAAIKGGDSSAILAGTAAIGVTAVAFPPVGALLVGATALTFATGAAHKAAAKLGSFLEKHAPPAPAPAK